MLVAYGVMMYVLRYTGVGPAHLRHRRRPGVRAAVRHPRRSGAASASTRWPGFIYAIGAWFLLGRINAASPQALQTANLEPITAVVIGGTSLFGGRGGVLGTLIGAIIVGTAVNGLTIAGFDPLWQRFAIGMLVIVAVGHRPVDQEGRRSDASRRAPAARPRRRAGLLQGVRTRRRPRPRRPRALPGRGPRRHRRQRRRQVDPHQVLLGAVIPDRGEILLDGERVHFTTPNDATGRRHRDGLPDPGRLPGAGHRHQPVPWPRAAHAGLAWLGPADARPRRACATPRARR